MTLTTLFPLAALAFFVLATLAISSRQPGDASPRWPIPAGLSVAFLAFSLGAIVQEGPLGFWENHSQNLWGNQVWFDLLIAFGIGWLFAVPRARAVGMRPLPWLCALLLTGGIGLLAMLARIFYLEGQQPSART